MLHLTLRQLRVFEASARHLSFSRAAEELHLTQPGVSSQLKQLETRIGMPLFEQVGRRVFLTAAGTELYSHTRLLEQQLSLLEESLDQLRDMKQGKLKVSLVSGTANPLALQLIAKFKRAFPCVRISLAVGNRECVLSELASNETDLAIMGLPPEGQGLIAVRVAANPLVMIAPPDHRLVRERRIALEALEGETLLVRESGSGTRRAMERFFAEHRTNFRPGMEVSSNDAIKWAVQAGMGLSVVPLATIMAELETLRLKVLDVEHFPIVPGLYMVHRESKQLSAAASAFRDILVNGTHEAAEHVLIEA
jgi:DNA-binding transcriptional LysR family regulator